MSDQDPERDRATRVVYTCWPFGREGHGLCGLLLIVIGGAMLAQNVFPDFSETAWGVALVLGGIWVMSRSRREERRW